MNKFLLTAAALSLVSNVALATGGLECRSSNGKDVRFWAGVAHSIDAPLLGRPFQLTESGVVTKIPRDSVVQYKNTDSEIFLRLQDWNEGAEISRVAITAFFSKSKEIYVGSMTIEKASGAINVFDITCDVY